jgi:hypothetical protein
VALSSSSGTRRDLDREGQLVEDLPRVGLALGDGDGAVGVGVEQRDHGWGKKDTGDQLDLDVDAVVFGVT